MTTTATEARRRFAELTVLTHFDVFREAAGHDYGSGQRAKELSRRRRELYDYAGGEALTDAELAEAFERVGRPRLNRVLQEDWRRSTPSSSRTVRTWEKVARRFGVEV